MTFARIRSFSPKSTSERDDQLPEISGGESCAAVISHQFWVTRFQQNSDVLHRTLRVRDMRARSWVWPHRVSLAIREDTHPMCGCRCGR